MDSARFATGNEDLDFVANEFANKAYINSINKPKLGFFTFNDTSRFLSYLFEEYKKTSKGGKPYLDYNLSEMVPFEALENLQQSVNQILLAHTDNKLQSSKKMIILKYALSELELPTKDGQTILHKDAEVQKAFLSKIIRLLREAGINQIHDKQYLFFERLKNIDKHLSPMKHNATFYSKHKYLKNVENESQRFKLLKKYRDKLSCDEFKEFLFHISESQFKKHIYAIHSFQLDLEPIRHKAFEKLYFHTYGLVKTTAKQKKYVLFIDMLNLQEKVSDFTLKHIFEYIQNKIS